MKPLIRFNSIPSFDKILKTLVDQAEYHKVKPKNFLIEGNVKVNGTNRSVVFDVNNELDYFQSRDNTYLAGDKQLDSYEFADFIVSNPDVLEYLKKVVIHHREVTKNYSDPVQIFGEWAGKNICGKVTNIVEHLPERVFFIIGVRASKDNLSKEYRTYDCAFGTNFGPKPKRIEWTESFGFEVVMVNFDNIDETIEKINRYTLAEETKSRLIHMFDTPPEHVVGEGLVWRALTGDDFFEKIGLTLDDIVFKTKGSEHKRGKRTFLAEKAPSFFTDINECAKAVLDGRLDQGISILKERGLSITMDNYKAYVAWVIEDIKKEDMDILSASNLVYDDISSRVGQAAHKFYREAVLTNT